MRLGRHLRGVMLTATLSTGIFVIEWVYLQGLGSPLVWAVTFGLLFGINALIEWVQQGLIPSPMKVLPRILNSCARDAVTITTIKDFITQSDEASLNAGDEVHILTNSLESYDTTPPAIRVIAQNLHDGVKYVYYLPTAAYPALHNQKDSFVDQVFRNSSALSREVVNSHLMFYEIEDECMYNFAIVRKQGNVTGYWYITTPTNDAKTRKLVILQMSQDHRDELMNIFNHLARTSKKFSALGKPEH